MSSTLTHRCGRRDPYDPAHPSPFKPPYGDGGVEFPDNWHADGTCSYCGSMSQAALLPRLLAGDVELTPTDKSYKVYVRNNGGAPLMQSYRDCPRDAGCTGPDDCAHWVTRETSQAKFYFQHLDEHGRSEFIRLYNERKLKLGEPGHFYVLPYFCKRAS
jgi:hypothetical protein